MLLGAPGLTTRNKKQLGANGIATRSKKLATRFESRETLGLVTGPLLLVARCPTSSNKVLVIRHLATSSSRRNAQNERALLETHRQTRLARQTNIVCILSLEKPARTFFTKIPR